jgi:predicted transcriptional regulator
VELGLLDHLREKGSVTNTKDRRTDFYRLDRA